jgi:hypothetical protein
MGRRGSGEMLDLAMAVTAVVAMPQCNHRGGRRGLLGRLANWLAAARARGASRLTRPCPPRARWLATAPRRGEH